MSGDVKLTDIFNSPYSQANPMPIGFGMGTTPFTEARIDQAGAGDTTLVAAVSGKITKVYRIFFVVAGATVMTIKDGATALTGAMTLGAGATIVLDFDGTPWFTGSTNTAFILNSTNAVQISGRAYYVNS